MPLHNSTRTRAGSGRHGMTSELIEAGHGRYGRRTQWCSRGVEVGQGGAEGRSHCWSGRAEVGQRRIAHGLGMIWGSDLMRLTGIIHAFSYARLPANHGTMFLLLSMLAPPRRYRWAEIRLGDTTRFQKSGYTGRLLRLARRNPTCWKRTHRED